MTEFVRYVAIADVTLLLMCGAAVRASYASAVPKVLDVLALVYGVVFAAVAVGVILNALSPIPPTPGVKAFVAIATPCTVAVVAITAWSLRRR